MIGLSSFEGYMAYDSPLLHDEQLRTIILDPDNSQIRKNLRIFILSTGCNGKDVLRDSKLGLTIESSAALLQKECGNIRQIGCLKSWSWKTTIKSAVPLNNFLSPGFKLVKTVKGCDCCDNLKRPCCARIVKDVTFD